MSAQGQTWGYKETQEYISLPLKKSFSQTVHWYSKYSVLKWKKDEFQKNIYK